MMDSTDSAFIHDANSDNFQALVLENSQRGPVLVNFCNRKEDPCQQQFPVLDKVIHEYDGRVLLINVDTDSEFVFSKEYGIASVPTLKLFRDGQVVETLHGYQSEKELHKLLERYVARDSDLKLADAIDLFTGGNPRAAYEMIAGLIVDDPVNPRLPLTMCKLLRHEGRYHEALKLIESLPSELRKHREIHQFYTLLGFFAERDQETEADALQARLQESPGDLEARRELVTHLVTQQEYETALQQLVEIMETEAGFQENYAQQAMLKLFTILGDEHPLVGKYRPRLRHYVH